jgi:hypothetical protein
MLDLWVTATGSAPLDGHGDQGGPSRSRRRCLGTCATTCPTGTQMCQGSKEGRGGKGRKLDRIWDPRGLPRGRGGGPRCEGVQALLSFFLWYWDASVPQGSSGMIQTRPPQGSSGMIGEQARQSRGAHLYQKRTASSARSTIPGRFEASRAKRVRRVCTRIQLGNKSWEGVGPLPTKKMALAHLKKAHPEPG